MPVNPDTFQGKVLLNVIDKIIIGGIAAIILILFQYRAHQYQQVLDASVSVSQIRTGILLKQRQEIIDLMDKYYLLIEEVKSGNQPADEDQREQSKQYLDKVRFIMFTLTPKDRFGELAENFIKSISKEYPFNQNDKLKALAILEIKIKDAVEEEKNKGNVKGILQSVSEIYPSTPEETLSSLRNNIKEVADEQKIKETALKFLQQISYMNLMLTEGEKSIINIEKQQDEIKEAYIALLGILRDESIKTVKSEIKSVK